MDYCDADAWRVAAMQRPDGVGEEEMRQRRARAHAFYSAGAGQPDADTLADHELYIRGKMDADEYRDYLFFKHGQGHSG